MTSLLPSPYSPLIGPIRGLETDPRHQRPHRVRATRFGRNGTDYRSDAEQDPVIDACIRWHNQRARPKTGFAMGPGRARHPDYPFEAA
jgi:hypothetical protein